MSLADIKSFIGPVQGHVYNTQNADETVYIRGRQYGFYREGGTLFKVNDMATPFLAELARMFPAELNKALGSLGWVLRKEVRAAIMAGGPPGTSWPKSAGIGKLHRKGDQAWRTRSANPNSGLFGHLYMAVGYKRDKANMRVSIGFLSKESVRLAVWLQQGFETPITAKMRRLFSARNLKISGKGSIVTPARPLIAPVFRAVEDQIVPYIEAKIASYLAEKKPRARAA
jgi:hypothetical protein